MRKDTSRQGGDFWVLLLGSLLVALALVSTVAWAESPDTLAERLVSLRGQVDSPFSAGAILDAAGDLVLESGQPMSSMQTCGGCHDTAFIRDSSDHFAAGVFEDDEIQCLACHSDFEPPAAWDPAWFEADGSLVFGTMDIHKPLDRNCASCHAVVNNRLDIPLTVTPSADEFTMTDRTGQIFAAQKIVNSGLNIKGKNGLDHPFDVHADRVVNCINCHYSLNNPVYYREREESRPDHLAFDPRRLSNAEYLQRPLHQLAKGSSRDGLGAFESANSMRRCESCHDATAVHEWLPYRERHFASLACESCHVPRLHGPALQMLDWTLVDADGEPRRIYRDVEGDPTTADSLIHGFRPAMLARDNVDGKRKLAPFNLVSSWYWLAGEPERPLTREQFDHVLDVNLKGYFNYMRAAAPVFREQRSGKIVNVASLAAMERVGVALPDDQKARYREIRQEIAALQASLQEEFTIGLHLLLPLGLMLVLVFRRVPAYPAIVISAPTVMTPVPPTPTPSPSSD